MSKRKSRLCLFYVAVIMATLLFTRFVLCLAVVYGPSMEPALQQGNIVVVRRWKAVPSAGDVVITNNNNPLSENLIKRVVATEYQEVVIEGTTLYIDGQEQLEVYLSGWQAPCSLSLVVPAGEVFLLGDNRDASRDSRQIGCVALADLQGIILFRLF